MSNQRPWLEQREADRLVDVYMGEILDLNALPLDTPTEVKCMLKNCLALNSAERPSVEKVLRVLQDAGEQIKAEYFDIFLSYSWGWEDRHKPLTDKIYSSLLASGYI